MESKDNGHSGQTILTALRRAKAGSLPVHANMSALVLSSVIRRHVAALVIGCSGLSGQNARPLA